MIKGGDLGKLQPDHINMDVFFWYIEKNDLYNVLLCKTGHPVFVIAAQGFKVKIVIKYYLGNIVLP